MNTLVHRALSPLTEMSALKVATLANIAIILIAELIAIAAWYALYGVYGSAVVITAAITLIASALPLVTIGIYMMKKLDGTTQELVRSKLALKNKAAELLRQKDEQLQQASGQLTQALDQLASANHSTAQCLALVSHELRTPLNAILGFSEAMQKQTFGPIGSSKYHEFAENIHKSGAYLMSVINDVLELSKIENGTGRLEEEHIDVAAFLEELRALVEDVCAHCEVTLSIDRDDEVAYLWADPVKLKQILVNLVTNALRYTAAGGSCRIEARLGDGGGAEFHVVDTGSSIAVENGGGAAEIPSHEGAPQGLIQPSAGIGLPLSRALAAMHGGGLDMEREADAGSRMIVKLPADRLIDPKQEYLPLEAVG